MEHITCDCPVLGTWQSGLIVLHDGRAAAVGKSQVHHNLYPTSTKLLESELLRVVSHKVDMRGRTLRGLIEPRQAPNLLPFRRDDGGECKLEGVEDLDLYRPVDCDGKALRFHYARMEELGPYLGLVAAQG